jgi:hypothetical protein
MLSAPTDALAKCTGLAATKLGQLDVQVATVVDVALRCVENALRVTNQPNCHATACRAKMDFVGAAHSICCGGALAVAAQLGTASPLRQLAHDSSDARTSRDHDPHSPAPQIHLLMNNTILENTRTEYFNSVATTDC